MLWTDGVFVWPSDLTRLDSEVEDVAASNGITLTGYNGLLRGAIEEASNDMMKYVVSFGGYLNSGDLSANHLAAVLNVGIGNSVRQKVGLQQIVVSGDVPGQWTWLKQWAVYLALKAFYRNAFARVGGDRFKVKMDFYASELQRRIVPTLWAMGVPVVIQPLVRPGAEFEINSGTWGSANVSLVSGTSTQTTPLAVAITYCDMSQANRYIGPSQKNNSESNGSEVVSVTPASNQVVGVDISSLNPPTGVQALSQTLVVVVSPMKATHWNLYVGLANVGSASGYPANPLYLQNLAPIPVAVGSYVLPGDPVLSGPMLDLGQRPDRRLSLIPTRQRA